MLKVLLTNGDVIYRISSYQFLPFFWKLGFNL